MAHMGVCQTHPCITLNKLPGLLAYTLLLPSIIIYIPTLMDHIPHLRVPGGSWCTDHYTYSLLRS